MISGLNFYQEMVIVFEALISSVISYVLLHCYEVIKQKKPLASFGFEEMGAFMVLGIGLIMGLSDLQLAGLSVSGILCRLGIMIAAYLWGFRRRSVYGVMSGIIPYFFQFVCSDPGMYSIYGSWQEYSAAVGR
jgi:stage II sporulation protein E